MLVSGSVYPLPVANEKWKLHPLKNQQIVASQPTHPWRNPALK